MLFDNQREKWLSNMFVAKNIPGKKGRAIREWILINTNIGAHYDVLVLITELVNYFLQGK